MEQDITEIALKLNAEAERNIAREVVMALSRGDILLQGGHYLTAEDIEADRMLM